MVTQVAAVSLTLACVVVSAVAQRSPYAGASDPGVLPQYLPDDGSGNRFGNSDSGTPPPKIHQGTLETEALYNRVQSWPDDKKPFWFLNSVALEAQRKQQQQQAAQQAAQAQNRQPPFAAASTKNGSFRRSSSQ